MWHPHTDILASCSYDDTIKLFANDLDDGDWSTIASLTGHESTVWAIDFDCTGNRLASCSDDRTLKIWEKSGSGEKDSTWTCVATVAADNHSRPIYDVSWNKTNGLLATACGDDFVRVFKEVSPGPESGDKVSFELVHKIKAHESDVNCVKWHPKLSNYLASAGDDGRVKIWKWVDTP